MHKKYFEFTYDDIISVENLLEAGREFRRGKKSKSDVMEFEYNLMDNILNLHDDLKNKTYKHGDYQAFKINDPKPRDIHKASVRDRVLHHAVYKILYPEYNKTFISDSYSCRVNKGTHKAIYRFEKYTRKVSQNYTRQCWILKCDIRKFFASIDQNTLIKILEQKILDRDILNLLQNIIQSFDSGIDAKGLPLGNLTSQLLVNIYMNEFDQYVKHNLKQEYYIRYADDFVFVSDDKKYLESVLFEINIFLKNKLCLDLHPNKCFFKTIYSGVDFLGWVHFPRHRVLRTSTKKRVLQNINDTNISSYLGLLQHGQTYKISSCVSRGKILE
jgi:retron-type reverse transcriptase